MHEGSETPEDSVHLSLVVRRTFRADAQALFDAWTQPRHLTQWWGPAGVTCPAAEIDLRVGGRYRIANKFPDGTVVWIAGQFERIARPHLLAYTWRIESEVQLHERVVVRFEARSGATEIIVSHERIPDAPTRDLHAKGWQGCLTRLQGYME